MQKVPTKPNLLFVYVNGMRYDALGFNGNPLAFTPCLDGFAGESMCFDNAVSGQPLETPFAAALFTGKYSVETGAVINGLRISTEHVTFADVLGGSGYDTLFFGRWHLYAAQLGHYGNTKNSYVPEGEYRLGFNTAFGSFNGSGEFFAPKSYYHLNSPAKLYSKGFEADFQTELAIEKIEGYENSDKPFALFLSYGSPCGTLSPDNVPKKYCDIFANTSFPVSPNHSDKNDPHADIWSRFFGKDRNGLETWKRCSAAMTVNIDENFGRLTDTLKKCGLYDNTLIVFTSSKGEMFGSHGRRSANIFYDEAVHVPLLMKYGDRLAAARNGVCINTPDIMPTVLSLLGLGIPDAVSGRDISRAVVGSTEIENDCLLIGTGPAAIWGDGREWRGVRTAEYTYAVYLSGGEEFLFKNSDDKYQQNNLVGDAAYADVLNSLKNTMQVRMDGIGDKFRKNSFYKKNFVSKRKIKKSPLR